ncbi:hypothetical protein NDU88_002230 [Pleurodeles waltl]|uniref:Uncharacterized protein n=1 Tax=Pleurodeles waltl TaxID=8319 RepID=A0AAV7QCB4_PLEWA|nr:hypothetical protein NDU88_002230 [Pleurodeles waltl]
MKRYKGREDGGRSQTGLDCGCLIPKLWTTCQVSCFIPGAGSSHNLKTSSEIHKNVVRGPAEQRGPAGPKSTGASVAMCCALLNGGAWACQPIRRPEVRGWETDWGPFIGTCCAREVQHYARRAGHPLNCPRRLMMVSTYKVGDDRDGQRTYVGLAIGNTEGDLHG